MKYIKIFETHDPDYLTYINSSDKDLPNLSYCEDLKDVHFNKILYENEYLTFIALENGTFSFTKQGTGDNIQYSIDKGKTWTTLESGTSTPVITKGTKIFWKATLTPTHSSPYGIGQFNSTNYYDVAGNIFSLIYGDNFKNTEITAINDIFHHLFKNNYYLKNAKNLILASIIGSCSHRQMFYGCSALITAPKLPATTLVHHAYKEMFYGCSSLLETPELNIINAGTSACSGMFRNCTSLIKAMDQLNVNPDHQGVGTYDGYTFQNMFEGCTSLTKTPKLLGQFVHNWSGAERMFYGCTSLNYINIQDLEYQAGSFPYWVQNVSSTGTFVMSINNNSEWPTGTSGIPENWTVVKE